MNEVSIAVQAFQGAIAPALNTMAKAMDKAATAASQYVTAYQSRTAAMVEQTKLLKQVTNDGQYIHVFMEMAPAEEGEATPGSEGQ